MLYRFNIQTYCVIKAANKEEAMEDFEAERMRIKKSKSIAEDLLINTELYGVERDDVVELPDDRS